MISGLLVGVGLATATGVCTGCSSTSDTALGVGAGIGGIAFLGGLGLMVWEVTHAVANADIVVTSAEVERRSPLVSF